MNRRAIPEYDMNESGPEHLRRRGILVMPFMDSLRHDPRRRLPHVHEFFQFYLIRGRASIMVDFQEFEVGGTNAVFISPGQVHKATPVRELQGMTISFTQLFFDGESTPPSRLLELPFFFPDGGQPWLRLRSAEALEVEPLLVSLAAEYDRGLSDAEEILRATLRLALLRLGRLYTRAFPDRKSTRGAALVRQFHGELEKHFRKQTAIASYAAALGITANHLNDVVYEQTGHSAGDWIRRRRLLDAKRMLFHSQMNISEIGYTLGFEDASYFARFFRRYEGVTPTEFLEKFREKYR
jgi:AraC-like DNA-binding protein